MGKMPSPEPPKPSKILSGGFEGAFSEPSPIIEYPSDPSPEVPPLDSAAATAQIFRWASVRCVRRRDLWGSEKSLWCDYVSWLQQKVSVVPRERFAELLDQLFRREMDGWQGIALAVDVAAVEAPASRHIM
jgi:hypothetical protein